MAGTLASQAWVHFYHWAKTNPGLATLLVTVTVYAIWFFLLRLAILCTVPLAVLRWNEKLANLDYKLPKWLGEATVPFRNLLLVGLYRDHPRLLDAWVARHIAEARRAFEENRTFLERKTYVPLPVVLKGKSIAELKPEHLRPACNRKRWCLLIRGEGGLGKTTLACQLATWAMAEEPHERLCQDHQMIPVLIEPGLGFDVLQDVPRFRREILGRLQRLIGETHLYEELFDDLLRNRRVLVILDGLSEMPTSAEEPGKARLENPDFPAAALIVTSRNEERLREGDTIVPARVDKERLVGFMSAYVAQAVQADVTDAALFEASRRLAEMLSEGGREATPLLAKLYAEQLVGLHENEEGLQKLPGTIPDLMLSYLSNLNRYRKETDPDNRSVHRAAKIVAWQCLRDTFRPAQARKEEVRANLREEGLPETLLEYLEKCLGVVRTVPPEERKVTFLLDPLSEYLAGLQVLEMNLQNGELWRDFLRESDGKPGAPAAIRGFSVAVRDACLAKGEEHRVPEFVAEEFAKRIGLDIEAIKAARIQRRIQRLIGSLQTSDEAADREYAVKELGKMARHGQQSVPALIAALKDSDAAVRRAAVTALWNLNVTEAIPHLRAALNDSEAGVRVDAAWALGYLSTNEAVPELRAALHDNEAGVRSAAVLAIANLKMAEAVPELRAALNDSEAAVRAAAASSLGRLCVTEAIPELRAALNDSNAEVRCNSANALWFLRATEAVPELRRALQDTEGRVRSAAASALEALEAAEAIPDLHRALHDREAEVRTAAASALASLQAKEAVPELLATLKNSDNGKVRSAAAKALGRLQAKTAIPDLRAAFHDSDVEVRSAAVEALGHVGDREAIPDLRSALKDTETEVRRSAVLAMMGLNVKEAISDLRAMLMNDADDTVRFFAVSALAHLEAREALPEIHAALHDKEARIRAAAVKALGELKDKEAVPELRAALEDADEKVRAAARAALDDMESTQRSADAGT